ncbi:hypothetical protein [Weissella bombi]|uniref:hypothetical protein n=1 Tax=Weissella bombi TaxID=1505725 RepID=UPI003AF274A0
MSYVNVYLGGDFISVVSDTQITRPDGTILQEEMKKFLVTDQKVLIATAGNADVAKIMFDFFKKNQGLQFHDVVAEVDRFLGEIPVFKDFTISQRVIVAGFEKGIVKATSLGMKINQKSEKVNYESGSIIDLIPEDYNFNIGDYSKRLKTFTPKGIVDLQKKALLKVSRHSKQVNDTICEEVITDGN